MSERDGAARREFERQLQEAEARIRQRRALRNELLRREFERQRQQLFPNAASGRLRFEYLPPDVQAAFRKAYEVLKGTPSEEELLKLAAEFRCDGNKIMDKLRATEAAMEVLAGLPQGPDHLPSNWDEFEKALGKETARRIRG